MGSDLRICHVVNSVRDTSMPGDLATTQAELDAVSEVSILAWFEVEPFRNDDLVDCHCLNVPRGTFRITRSQYGAATELLSGYDVVHTHHPHSGFYGKLIATRLRKPIVNTEHNNRDGFSRKGRIANGLTNVFADRVAPVSVSVRDSSARWERALLRDGRVQVINNGVDTERIVAARSIDWSIHDVADVDPEAVIVGSAGMLTEQKAHEVLIEAVDRANDQSPVPIELVISGDGELRAELQSRIDAAEYSDRLHLLGFLERREQVYKMMHEIDIYAMPSRWEGFCVAALEAMAVGNACIYSAIPEFEYPFEGVARFHSPDDPGALADEIVTVATDEDTRAALAEAGRELILDQYTIERSVEQYLDCYRAIT
jgi:glycosyltransferase involved in cell wall biosynthesis